MQFIIIEKDNKINKLIKNVIRRLAFHFSNDSKIAIFKEYNSELSTTIKDRECKIYIIANDLDGKFSGVEIAKIIRKIDLKSIILFVTTHDELFTKVHESIPSVYRFIRKNKSFVRNLTCDLRKILLKNFQDKKFIYHTTHDDISIFLDSITYILRDKNERKLILYTDNNSYKLNLTFKKLLPYLDERFQMSHRSCLVNTERIEIYDWKNKELHLDSGITIPYLSRKYRKNIFNCI